MIYKENKNEINVLSTCVYQSNVHDDDSVSIDIATKEDGSSTWSGALESSIDEDARTLYVRQRINIAFVYKSFLFLCHYNGNNATCLMHHPICRDSQDNPILYPRLSRYSILDLIFSSEQSRHNANVDLHAMFRILNTDSR